MRIPSIRSLIELLLGAPRGTVPKSFSAAQRHTLPERSMNPLEHSGLQPLGTPEFDHINYKERRERYGQTG